MKSSYSLARSSLSCLGTLRRHPSFQVMMTTVSSIKSSPTLCCYHHQAVRMKSTWNLFSTNKELTKRNLMNSSRRTSVVRGSNGLVLPYSYRLLLAKNSFSSESSPRETLPPPLTSHDGKKPSLWEKIKHECKKYWIGSKLLWADMKISSHLASRLIRGDTLSRREHRQLERTTGDMFRLIPFSFFVVVPFAEFALPIFLKFFPRMLPSTFEDDLQKEEYRKKLLRVRLEMAKFLRNTFEDLTSDSRKETAEAAKEFAEYFRKIRISGEPVKAKDTIRFSHLFENELTLQNLSRSQLMSLCKYMSLYAIGTDSFMRYQLENKMDQLLRDDKMILAEGIESLTPSELHSACIARGMRALGVPDWKLRQDLKEWLELHVHQKVPTTLLLLSRTFSIQEDVSSYAKSEALESTLSSLPDQLIKQTELKVASTLDGKSKNELQLELIKSEEELIRLEREEQQQQQRLELSKKSLESGIHSNKEKELIHVEKISVEDLKKLGDVVSILSSSSPIQKEKEELNELKKDRQKHLDELLSRKKSPEIKQDTQTTTTTNPRFRYQT